MKKDNKQVAIIERGEDGRYSVYIENKNYPYGIIGTGATVKAAMADFLAGYEEMKECVESTAPRCATSIGWWTACWAT